MKRLRYAVAIFLLGPVLACGGDDHEEHEFGATTECDAFFEVDHDDNADCQADHAADVTAGVPQTAIDAHCDAEFPA